MNTQKLLFKSSSSSSLNNKIIDDRNFSLDYDGNKAKVDVNINGKNTSKTLNKKQIINLLKDNVNNNNTLEDELNLLISNKKTKKQRKTRNKKTNKKTNKKGKRQRRKKKQKKKEKRKEKRKIKQ